MMFFLASVYLFVWGWNKHVDSYGIALFVLPAILFLVFEVLIQTFLGEFNFARIFMQIGFSWFLLFLVCFFSDKRFDSKLFFRFFCFFGLLLSLVVISQYFNVFGFNNLYYPLLGTDRAVAYLSMEYDRVIGFYGNPNEVGFVFGIMVFVAILAFDKLKIKAFFIGFFFLAVVLSQSRTVWVALASSLFIFCILGRINIVRYLIFIALSVVSFFVFSYFFDVDKFYSRAFEFTTLRLRIEDLWAPTMEAINQNPFLGSPDRESILATDNEFLSVWVRYGFFPLIALLFWFVLIFSSSLSFGRVSEGKRILFSLTFYLLVCSVAIDTFIFRFKITSLFSLVAIIYAFYCARARVPSRAKEKNVCHS
jgi:hypothetical protein